MPTWLTLSIAVAAVTAIFLTTPAGQRVASGLGIDALVKDGPPKDDREFMLRVCDGDRAELKRRLDAERSRNPDMSEAQVYRRAIRTYMNSKETSDA